MARKDFVAFYFLLYRMWGCLILSLMAQNITKMRKKSITFFFFQPPKFHAAQDEMKQEDHL